MAGAACLAATAPATFKAPARGFCFFFLARGQPGEVTGFFIASPLRLAGPILN
jgi:hypothetical protein